MNEITFSVLKFELLMRMSRSVGDRILTPMLYIFFLVPEWTHCFGVIPLAVCCPSVCCLEHGLLALPLHLVRCRFWCQDLDAHSPCLCTSHLLNFLAMCSCQFGVFLFYFFEHVLWWFICHMLLYCHVWHQHMASIMFVSICYVLFNPMSWPHHPLVTLLLVHLPHLLS